MIDLQKAKYILPNIFTLSSVYAGIYSIYLSSTAETVQEMTFAAWLIIISMVCDLFDGRVARLTKTESAFGIQLDSLADAISFGVAPAFLLFSWGLTPLGGLGLFFAFIYAACAIMRLARFNVMAANHSGVMKYFLGLPTPLAAGTIVAVVLAHISVSDSITTGAEWSVAAMAILLGGLMVSNVRYRTFKDVNFRGPAMFTLLGILSSVTAVSIFLKPSVSFVILMVAYVFIGLGGGILNLGRNFLYHEPHHDEDFLEELESVIDDYGHDIPNDSDKS